MKHYVFINLHINAKKQSRDNNIDKLLFNIRMFLFKLYWQNIILIID